MFSFKLINVVSHTSDVSDFINDRPGDVFFERLGSNLRVQQGDRVPKNVNVMKSSTLQKSSCSGYYGMEQ